MIQFNHFKKILKFEKLVKRMKQNNITFQFARIGYNFDGANLKKIVKRSKTGKSKRVLKATYFKLFEKF